MNLGVSFAPLVPAYVVWAAFAAAILISPVLLLSKSRRHYVTIGYVDAADRQQVLVLRIEKGDIRPVLAALEARTGRRVEYQDDEARKSGK